MNRKTTQRAELSFDYHKEAVVDHDAVRGFISHCVNAYSVEGGVNIQIASVLQGGLALELLEILRPEFPGCKFTIVRHAEQMDEFATQERCSSRVKDLVIWLRESDEPGEDFLTLTGYRGDAKRLAWGEPRINPPNSPAHRLLDKVEV